MAAAAVAKRPAQVPGGDWSSLAIYGRCWCLHQFVPFVDKALGLAGAMDNRMLGPNDFPFRLPVLLVAFAFPTAPVLLVAHVVNVVSWAFWMPRVWDYMCWCALTEMVFIVAALTGGGDEKVAQRFVPAVKAQLIILYFSAAFWKLTSSWFDLRSSCATILMSELLSSPLFPPGPETFYNLMLMAAPVLVAGLEFAVPIGLWLAPCWLAVPLALIFHQTINLMPMTYAGGFSIAMCTRMHLFIPRLLPELDTSTPEDPDLKFTEEGASWLLPSALVAVVLAIMVTVHGRLDTAGTAFLIFTTVYLRAILQPGAAEAAPAKEGGAWLRKGAWTVGFLYGFVGPVLGLQAMGSSTMYGNVLQFGGNNHWVVPTGLLQTHFADRKPDVEGGWLQETLVDAFGGGMLRVELTSSKVMNQLCPAEATQQLPARARELLPTAGSAGRYFEMYAARNYFERPMFNLSATAIKSGAGKAADAEKPKPLAYVLPAFELRRLLGLARARKETFQLTYTLIPSTMRKVSEWRAMKGAKVELVEQEGRTVKCTLGDEGGQKRTACGATEIAMLPPPPRWLQWMLVPYPVPLIPGEVHDEVHCST